MPAESNDPVRKADQESLLLTEAFVLGQTEPSVWELYWQGRCNDVKRRIRERYPDADGDGGAIAPGSAGTLDGVGAPGDGTSPTGGN